MPNVFKSRIAKENSVKQCEVGQYMVPNKPIDQDDANGKDGEADGNIYNGLLGIVTANVEGRELAARRVSGRMRSTLRYVLYCTCVQTTTTRTTPLSYARATKSAAEMIQAATVAPI